MKEYDKIYKSAEGEKSFQLATGYISTTEILFEEEKVAAKIEASGKVELYDLEENLLATLSVPEQTGGKETYNDVLCSVKEGAIILKLPIVEWIDNYPHCDGEYDRWDSRIIGYEILKYDL